MKTLLIINTTCNMGSTGRIAEFIGEIASNTGWRVFYAHGSRYVSSSHHSSLEIGSKVKNNFHALWNYGIKGEDGLGSLADTKRLIKEIEIIKPDVINLHNLHGYYINYRCLFEYLNSTSIKVVWTMHDCWPFTGGCTYLNHCMCEKWKYECGKCPLHGDFPKHPLLDNSKNNFLLKKDLFGKCRNLLMVPVSDWLRDLTNKSFLSNKRIKVIHNGVDLSVFKPYVDGRYREKYGIEEEYLIIGVASPWSKRKGLDDFLRLNELLGENYKIILVGVNNKQLSRLPDNIIGIKRTSNVSELAKLYSTADVFVNLTYSDNFPTTNIEALACGTPVITYKTGGAPEAVDNKTGIVVEQGDLRSVVSAIEQMRTNPLNPDLCRNRAELLFDRNKCYKEYLEIFENAVISH